jgi:hypothetical protein
MTYGQLDPLDLNVLAALHAAAPSASWDHPLSATGDVMCDGKTETIVVGSEGETVWLGVVTPPNGKTPRKALTISWPIGAGVQAAMCSKPIRIELYPLICDTENGKLDGCKPSRHCQAFSLVDDECDPINVYWDSSKHRLTWWRN